MTDTPRRDGVVDARIFTELEAEVDLTLSRSGVPGNSDDLLAWAESVVVTLLAYRHAEESRMRAGVDPW